MGVHRNFSEMGGESGEKLEEKRRGDKRRGLRKCDYVWFKNPRL
jgi:hypothetical protein